MIRKPPPAESLAHREPVEADITRFQGTPDDIKRACHTVSQAAARAGFNATELKAIDQALSAALWNAIRHGHHNDPHKYITLEYLIDPRSVSLTVTDEGPGFRVPRTVTPRHGVDCMRQCMNAVVYNREGNQVTLVKWHTSQGSSAA